MSELSGVARLLNNEYCYGWSLARKVEALIEDRDRHKARCDELREQCARLNKVVDAQRAAIDAWQDAG